MKKDLCAWLVLVACGAASMATSAVEDPVITSARELDPIRLDDAQPSVKLRLTVQFPLYDLDDDELKDPFFTFFYELDEVTAGASALIKVQNYDHEGLEQGAFARLDVPAIELNTATELAPSCVDGECLWSTEITLERNGAPGTVVLVDTRAEVTIRWEHGAEGPRLPDDRDIAVLVQQID